jgi:hypothetical protein
MRRRRFTRDKRWVSIVTILFPVLTLLITLGGILLVHMDSLVGVFVLFVHFLAVCTKRRFQIKELKIHQNKSM